MDLNKYDTLEEKLKNVNYGTVMLKFIRKRLGFKSYGELYPRDVEIFLYENLNVNTNNNKPDMPINQKDLNAYSITMHYLRYYGALWMKHVRNYPDNIPKIMSNKRVQEALPEEVDRICWEISNEIRKDIWLSKYP